ncbi:MAG: L,D-transpeptidase, partial [Microthrixaceae bacterium]
MDEESELTDSTADTALQNALEPETGLSAAELEEPEQPEQPEQPDKLPPYIRVTNFRLFVAAVVGAVLIAVLLAVLIFRPAPIDPSKSKDSNGRPGTSSVPEVVSDNFEIATAKSSVTPLKVLANKPEGWDSAKRVSLYTTTVTVPPFSQDGLDPRRALPTIEAPIQGRRSTAEGWEFDNPGPYSPPQPFTMLVSERRGDWLKVLLPLRPNHTEGYVAIRDVDLSSTQKRIEVDLTTNLLVAFDGDKVVAQTQIVAGAANTQTPTGLFYVTDIVPQKNPAGAYGPVALATNGYSEMMDEFATGAPVVALHGTNNPGKIGTDVSNGCIRMPNEIILQLAEIFPQG